MKYNQLLKQFTYEVYLKRPIVSPDRRTNYRIERVNGGLLCDLWFLTAGCMHDAQGGCVMCNYGRGECSIERREWERIIEELKSIIRKIPFPFEDFLLTPSGSMLDEREVPPTMRDMLIPALHGIQTKRFIIETRADTVTDAGMEFLREIVPGAEKYVEIGLESSNNWILKHCINKASTFEEFCTAVNKIHEYGICVTANVGLGFPFMSERASIINTIQTIRDALDAGADSIVVFPYHIKKGTLLDVMYQKQMYQCVSFWALVKVLNCFPHERDKIQISWYKDYFGQERSYIYRSPSTCPACEGKIMKYLDDYRETQSAACVDRLNRYSCQCREQWEKTLQEQPDHIEIKHVEQLYRKLAECFNLDQDLLERELSEMKREFEGQKVG